MPITIPKRGEVCPAISTEPLNMTIIGYPGIGKSSALSVLPDAFFVDCQISPGYKFLPGRKVHVIGEAEKAGIHPHEAFISIIEQWCSDPSTFLVIDPITEIIQWAETYATIRFKEQPQGKGKLATIESVLDIPGKDETTGSRGWGLMYARFMELMRPVWARRDTRTIYVAHVREAMLTEDQTKGGKVGTLVDDKDIDLPGKLKGTFLSENDSAAYMYRDNSEGKLHLNFATKKSSSGSWLKNRCPRLMGKIVTFNKPTTEKDWVPASLDDWKQIYWETIPKALVRLATPATNPTP